MMAKRRPQKQRPGPVRGPRGKAGTAGARGAKGATGPPGPPGPTAPAAPDHTKAILALQQQVAQIVRELETQLTRIAQLQAQLDQVASGPASDSRRKGPNQLDH